jgi:hypothetical protein
MVVIITIKIKTRDYDVKLVSMEKFVIWGKYAQEDNSST